MSNTSKIYLGCILAIIWGIVFWASENTIWLGDDYYYQFIFEKNYTPLGDDNPTPIGDIWDVLVSQYHHYFNYNARITPHLFVQIFCGLLGHTWFAIFNGFAYIALIASLVYLISGSFQRIRTWLSVIVLVFISLMVHMVPSCQIGYIWTAVLDIVFIWLFLNGKRYKWWQLILIGIFSLISGNGHECYSIGISIGIILYWITHIKEFGATRYTAAIGYGLGTLLICISPATLNRTSELHMDIAQSLFFFLFSLKAMYILLLMIIYKLIRHKISLKRLYIDHAFYWNIMIACIIFNLAVGVMSHRQLFGIELTSMILILKLTPKYTLNRFWLWGLGCIALLSLWFNIERVYLLKVQEERIYAKYRQSDNGYVYQDTWGTGLLEGWNSCLWDNAFHMRSFKRKIRREFPNGPELVVLPEYLKGKDTLILGNEVYHFKYKPGKLLIIQSKENPTKFLVTRKFFGIIPYQVREMDFSDTWYETPYWRALVYDNLNPVIFNTDVVCE